MEDADKRKVWTKRAYDKMRADPVRWKKYCAHKLAYQKKNYKGKGLKSVLFIGPQMPPDVRAKLTHKRWYEENGHKVRARVKAWKKANPAQVKKNRRKYNIKNAAKLAAKRLTPHRKALKRASWERIGRETYKKYLKKYLLKYPEKRAAMNLRVRIASLVRSEFKHFHSSHIIGCSSEQLKIHLQAQFKPGMAWNNYGIKGWHVDHIRPCASFDLTDPEQQKQCFHYTNLQPLWALENLQKGAKYASA